MKNLILFLFISSFIGSIYAFQNDTSAVNLSTQQDSLKDFNPAVQETVFVKSLPETLKVVERQYTPFFSYPEKKNESVNSLKILEGIDLKILIEILIIFLIGIIISRLIESYKNKISAKSTNSFLLKFFTLVQVLVWFTVFYIIASVTLLTSRDLFIIILLSTILVIGFSSVPLFKNILGGFYIFVKKPFTSGDYIKLQNGIEGNVKIISWESTLIIGNEKDLIDIPNIYFIKEPFEIIKFQQKEELITMYFSFPFEFGVDDIMSRLKEAAISSPFSFIKKAPQIFLEETDYVNKINKFKLSVYVFDSNYRDELVSSINRFIRSKIKSHKNTI